MDIEQPGMVIFAALFAILGLYLLTRGPTVWRATYLFPIFFPVMILLLSLDQVVKATRGEFDLGLFAALGLGIVIVPAIFAAREYFGLTETWSIYNASRGQVIAALERAFQTHAIPFDWRVNRLRLPTIGIRGSALLISRWFGGASIEVIAADRDERRIVAQTVLPLLREQLSSLPRPVVPSSGVFCLVVGALLLAGATQLSKLFN